LIKIEHLETFGWQAALRGMRNPMESWNLSDSNYRNEVGLIRIGSNDNKLCNTLIKAGASHRKFLRMIHIQCDITACLKFWDEFATYEFTVCNSTSQMHKLGSRKLTKEDFSYISAVQLKEVNDNIDRYHESEGEEKKIVWRKMTDSIPQSFLYTRTVDFNYETFFAMYKWRKNHKMSEWVEFCDILRKKLHYVDQWLKIMETDDFDLSSNRI